MTGRVGGETSTTVVRLATAAAESGLRLRGGFAVRKEDGVPPLPDGRPPASVVLLGPVGGSLWPHFVASPECADGRRDPLDRWSRRVIDGIAQVFDAHALYPFGGPPYLPFQRWALRSEPVAPSPLGMLIHPEFGLWHGYRGALAFDGPIDLPAIERQPSPCETCQTRPCLSACPVDAFTGTDYRVDACRDHLERTAGRDCLEDGCRARNACPIGRDHAYPADQIRFHMAAFRRSGGSRRLAGTED